MAINPEIIHGEDTPHTPESALKDEMSRDAVLFAQEMKTSRARCERISLSNLGHDIYARHQLSPQEDRYWIVRRRNMYDTSGDVRPILSHCFDYEMTRGRGFAEARHLGMGLHSVLSMGYRSLEREEVDIVVSSAGKILQLVTHNCFTNATLLKTASESIDPRKFVCEDDLGDFKTTAQIVQLWRNDLELARNYYTG